MKKGYYVKGHFVAEGSEMDLALQLERKAQSQTDPEKPSRTEMKALSDAAQKLGERLLDLRSDLMQTLDLPDQLVLALAEGKRITNFEGRRRQMQFIGKLMRKLTPDQTEGVHAALRAQARGAPKITPLSQGN